MPSDIMRTPARTWLYVVTLLRTDGTAVVLGTYGNKRDATGRADRAASQGYNVRVDRQASDWTEGAKPF